MIDYEKLGAFYLGKQYDTAARKRLETPVLYDSKDLLTHAVIIGMTGSGKTGAGIGLLEEALIDNIPVIAIDPKGDLANLLLTFPDLAAEDFLPWIDPGEAARKAMTVDEFAAHTAATWRGGLAEWQQEPDRISRLRAAADFRIYTPGSTAGTPVNLLRNFAPPPRQLAADGDLLRERINATVTALLTLMGVNADPLADREHILLANIFEKSWSSGIGLDLAGLIGAIQNPPIERVGVLNMEAFYPAKERFQLALRLNNLLAAPGFDAWLRGDPLDIGGMLHTAEGKPRALIFSISHLNESERMFFTTLLLNEILAWVRTQAGTASLRALLYMDEIFGFFPPVQNPPSKTPLLTLLKQARAFGLGVVLSTQNPVDLDYKGLANIGTWFIGRLQTENDKERVMAGVMGSAGSAGFDRRKMGEILSGLGKRVFLLHNVHEPAPIVFETRWTLSFLSGPMTREQIRTISAGAPAPPALAASSTGPFQASAPAASAMTAAPAAPADVAAFFLPASGAGLGITYMPAVGGWVDMHYVNQRLGVEMDRTVALATLLEEGPLPINWEQAMDRKLSVSELQKSGLSGAAFGELPAAASRADAFKKWQKEFMQYARQNHPLVLFQSKRFKLTSSAAESQGAFRARLTQTAHEQRDLEIEKLRVKYADQFALLQNRRMRAEQVLAKEEAQAKAKKVESVISFGTAILGAFLGRKAVGAGSVSRVGAAMKSAGRLGKEQMDVAHAREAIAAADQSLAELEARLQKDIEALNDRFDPSAEPLDEIRVSARAADMRLTLFGLLWLPFRGSADGRLTPDWD